MKLSRLLYCFLLVPFFLFSCKAGLKSNERLENIDTAIITGNKYIDQRIETFSNKVKSEDHVKTFMIFICRKPESARISIVPIKTLRDTGFNVPTKITKKKGFAYLIYNGNELLYPPNEKILMQLELVRKNLPLDFNGVYDPPILQFDILSSTNIRQIIPPENPYMMESELKKKIDFKPPTR